MNTIRLLLLFVLCASHSFAKAEDAEVRNVWFKADVTVDAEGSPGIGQIEGVKGSLADAVRERLSRMSYVPAQFDGNPVASSATIRGKLVLTPMEGGMVEVRLANVVAGPAPIRSVPIRYPSERARAHAAGHVEILLTIDGAGEVTEVAIVSSSHRDFEKVVSDAFRKWRFTPGLPAPIKAPATVVFHMDNQEPPDVQFECALDPGRLHVSGQSGCVEQVTVTARRY